MLETIQNTKYKILAKYMRYVLKYLYFKYLTNTLQLWT